MEEKNKHSFTQIEDGLKREWLKKYIFEELEKNRLKHCDSITKEQYDLESNFVIDHFEKNYRIPTFLDAIEYGIEQGKKAVIDKIKSLIKEWELHTSAEAKYRMEAYKELLDNFMKL